MMKKYFLHAAFLSLLGSVTLLSAQEHATDVTYANTPVINYDGSFSGYNIPYLGAGFSLAALQDDYVDFFFPRFSSHTEVDYNSMMLQAGYQVNPYIAVEYRYWFSFNSDYDFGYDDFSAYGIYAKPMLAINEYVSLYGLVGFSGVTADAGFPILRNEGDFSWGAGLFVNVSPSLQLFVDYVSLFDDTLNYYDASQDTSVETYNFGITYKF